MTDVFYRYLNCHVRHVLLFFTRFGVFKVRIIITSSKINWAVLLSTWTKIFYETIAESLNYEPNKCHIRHVMYMTGETEKIECLFFPKWQKVQWQCFESKCCYSWKLYWPLVLIFQLPGSVLGYDNEDCQDHQFLLLKLQDFMQTTKYSLEIKQIH